MESFSRGTGEMGQATGYQSPKLIALGSVQQFVLVADNFTGVDAALPDTNGSTP